MRTFFKRLILVLVLSVGTSAFAQMRMATVDLGRVFTNYWKTKQAQNALDEHKADFDRADREKVTNFNKAKEEYQKVLDSVNDPAISSDEREKRQKDAESKLRDLNELGENIQEYERGEKAALYEQLQRTHDNIFSEIRSVVTARAKADGYTMVIDTAALSASGSPVVPYYVPGDNDLTDAVIKQINTGAPVEAPTSDEKPVDKDTK